MINIQPISKLDVSDGQFLDVHSIFNTIQGEGPFTGCPAVFIRLKGCNLQCPSCDTNYTEGGLGKNSVGSIVGFVKNFNVSTKLVVITGGEPFRQNITPLVKLLQDEGFKIQIETNGTLPPSEDFPEGVTVVCSPKTGKINAEIESFITAYKYVLSSESVSKIDGLPERVLNHKSSPFVARPLHGKKVYLQPMDTQSEKENRINLKSCVDSCMKYGYTLQLQIHKIIGVE